MHECNQYHYKIVGTHPQNLKETRQIKYHEMRLKKKWGRKPQRESQAERIIDSFSPKHFIIMNYSSSTTRTGEHVLPPETGPSSYMNSSDQSSTIMREAVTW